MRHTGIQTNDGIGRRNLFHELSDRHTIGNLGSGAESCLDAQNPVSFFRRTPWKDDLFTAAYEFGAQFNPFFFWPKLRLSTGIAKEEDTAYRLFAASSRQRSTADFCRSTEDLMEYRTVAKGSLPERQS